MTKRKPAVAPLNLGYHCRERALPVGLMLLHAAVAAAGVVVLAA